MPNCEPFLPTVWSLREPANLHTAAPPPAAHSTLREMIPNANWAHRATEETSAPKTPTNPVETAPTTSKVVLQGEATPTTPETGGAQQGRNKLVSELSTQS